MFTLGTPEDNFIIAIMDNGFPRRLFLWKSRLWRLVLMCNCMQRSEIVMLAGMSEEVVFFSLPPDKTIPLRLLEQEGKLPLKISFPVMMGSTL